MPISGPALHRQLLAAYADAQSRLEQERGQIALAHGQRQSLDGDRSNVLVALAEHYLPELSRDAVSSTWGEVQRDVAAILVRKEEHERRLSNEIHQHDQKRLAADQELFGLNEALDNATEQQHAVTAQVESQLRDDSRFVELSDRAAVAEVALERAEANLREIEQDSARKLPAFDQSSLFRYLYDRGFGTQRYSHRGFTRRMDRWLARFVKFNEACQSYDFLKQTPIQMRQIIAEDRSALDTVLDELERRRDEVAEQLGLPKLISNVSELTEQREIKIQRLESIRTELQSLQEQLTQLSDNRGPYYREAIKVFREMLDRVDTRDLKARAAATRELTDDQIVARLLGIESSIEQVDDAARKRRQTLDANQVYLEGLGRMIQQFRMAKYDSARSQFIGSLDLVDELSGVRNAQDMDDVWMRIRRAQRWGSSTMDQIAQVARHPMTQVLINAMAHAAAGALSEHARNAGNRRGNRSSGGGRRSSGGRGGGGFQNRDWF